jgi:hypothetical protein
MGAWQWMAHGRVFASYVREDTPKGGWTAGSMNWLMVSASRAVARARFTFRAMGSLEALTLGECGYPRLFAAGAACPHDGFGEYQHAHAPIMELSAHWTQPVGASHALSLFAAVVGEPALGPVPYLHRASATSDPVAPISAHDMNAAHASRGVVTAAVTLRSWKVEVSAFQGETARADAILARPGPLESAAGRISWNPSPAWSLQVSAARIIAPSNHHANASGILEVATASASNHLRIGSTGGLYGTAAWSMLHDEVGSRHSVLLEGTVEPNDVHTLFLRLEAAHRFDARFTPIENPDGSHQHRIEATRHNVAQLSGGFALSARINAIRVGAGARAAIHFIPPALFQYYRSDTAVGFALFAALTPATTPHTHDR